MNIFLTTFQIILAIITIASIFLQQPADSDNNSNILSGTSFNKRGWEKVTFIFTLVISVVFVLVSLIQAVI